MSFVTLPTKWSQTWQGEVYGSVADPDRRGNTAENSRDQNIENGPNERARTGGQEEPQPEKDAQCLSEMYKQGAGEDETEDSLLNYARFHGLTIDRISSESTVTSLIPEAPADLSIDLADPPNSVPFEVAKTLPKSEIWTVDADAASLLRSVIALAGGLGVVDTPLPKLHCPHSFRVELPILMSDHERDMIEYRRGVKGNVGEDTSMMQLPLATVDEDDDEGFEWPTKYKSLPEKFDTEARSEKFQVTREQLLCLQELLRDTLTAEDLEVAISSELQYAKRRNVYSVTPPLVPLSPLLNAAPVSPIFQLEPLSDRTSPTLEERRLVDEQIWKDDNIVPVLKRKEPALDPMLFDEDDLSRYYSPLESIGRSPSLSPLKRVKLADLKVECPLTPPTSMQVSSERTAVTFSENLEEMLPSWPPAWEKPEDALSSQVEMEAFFNDTVGPIAKQAERQIRQEQLQVADSTMRVDVAILDFALPDPPWRKLVAGSGLTESKDCGGLDYVDLNEIDLQKSVWSGISTTERQLPWSPFPLDLGRFALDESIVNDENLSHLLKSFRLDEVVNTESLVWKPDGIRILDGSIDEEDECELEPALFGEKNDFSALLRKRKLQLDEEEGIASGGDKAVAGLQKNRQDEGVVNAHVIPEKRTNTESTPRRSEKSDTMFGGTFSASEALDRFIGIQGRAPKVPKRRDPEARTELPTKPPKEPPTELLTPANGQLPASRSIFQAGDEVRRPAANQPDSGLLEPYLPENPAPRAFISSSTLFINRCLMRHLRSLYPAAEFIERHFQAPVLSNPRQSHQNPGTAAAEEADLILSPSTGLLLTTLPKIKQRSLPGQVARNHVRERIQKLVPRYERLLVLVSEGRPAPPPPTTIHDHFSPQRGASIPQPSTLLQESDCEALGQLTSFTCMLDTEVNLTYVPGGEEQLARWIVAAMHRYGVDGLSSKLLQDETLWEIWLRQAGTNAFAAQVILSELKDPKGQSNEGEKALLEESSLSDDDTLRRSSAFEKCEYGLSAFVLMRHEYRISRFEALLGGRNVLDSVGAVVDGRWEQILGRVSPT